MRLRVTLLTTAILAGLAGAVVAAGSASAAGAAGESASAVVPAHAAACTTVQTLTYTQSQATAAQKYWTPSRIKAAKGLGRTGLAGLAGLTATQSSRSADAPSSSVRCLPDSTVTHTSALPAALDATGAARLTAAAAVTASDGHPTIGKLTYKADGVLDLSCTATVINGTSATNNEELILTAAHCVEGTTDGIPYTTTDLAFSPKWNNGDAPYGTWTSKEVFLNSGWMSCGIITCSTNPADDYAIIVLNQQSGKGVGDVTGADAWNSGAADTLSDVTIAGIPSSATDLLTTTTSATAVAESGVSYRTAATPGYTDGTSGGPWLTGFNTTTGLGTLIGDTGGYEQGGPSSGTPSYSDVWNSAFATVVADAVAYED
jgi:V8-like Glu-specific endopeptidase